MLVRFWIFRPTVIARRLITGRVRGLVAMSGFFRPIHLLLLIPLCLVTHLGSGIPLMQLQCLRLRLMCLTVDSRPVPKMLFLIRFCLVMIPARLLALLQWILSTGQTVGPLLFLLLLQPLFRLLL